VSRMVLQGVRVRVRIGMMTCVGLALLGAAMPLRAQLKPATPESIAADDASVQPKPSWTTPLNPKLPTLWLVGDSTMHKADGHGAAGMWGWGEPITSLFDTSKINVVNRAIGGRSSRSFITEGHWDEILAMMKPGDVVIIQFGHNDHYPLDDAVQARGTIPGIGEESQEIENQVLKRHETVHTYGWYLRRYVADTRAHKAIPILCSPVPRKVWKDGKIASWDDTYAPWAVAVAQQEKVDLLDLYAIIGGQYNAEGPQKVEEYFGDPGTHTNLLGARKNAAAVVAGLKALADDPLAKYFSVAGAAVPAYVSSQLNTGGAKVLSYDVISVKQHTSGENSMMGSKYRPDGFTCTNLSLLNLIVNVYGKSQNQISGGPSWIDTIGFDVEAKVADSDVEAFKKLGPEQRNDLLKTLLADRFKLKVHVGTKGSPMYDLVVAKGGPKFKVSAPVIESAETAKDPQAAKPRGSVESGPGMFEGRHVSMEQLASHLSFTLHSTVVDKTDITGLYNLDLKWRPDEAGSPNEDAELNPSIFTALQEKLGLKLIPTKGSIETLIIDHAEMPSAN
jgi:rhamnogalacturonan acetylesterase